MRRIQWFFLLSAALIINVSCDPDDPEPPNEEEVITSVIYTLTPMGGGSAVTMSWIDLDGDGSNPASITGGDTSSQH